jgi:hypothetical protein
MVDALPASLRALGRTGQCADDWPELGKLARLPRLEELTLHGRGFFDDLAHPRLRRLELALTRPFAQVVGLSPRALPRLTELAFDGTASARDFDYLLDVLIAKSWLVRVTKLALRRGELTALGIASLEAGLAGRRLAELDLTGTRIHPSMRARLAALCEELVAPTLVEIAPEAPYVEHTGRPEWGRGYVVRRFDGKVEVEFAGVGRRVFLADAAVLRYSE